MEQSFKFLSRAASPNNSTCKDLRVHNLIINIRFTLPSVSFGYVFGGKMGLA